MTPTMLFVIAAVLVTLFVLLVHRRSRIARARRTFDVGAVSTRWLSELRRDEPWISS
jgi:hypothetical protein